MKNYILESLRELESDEDFINRHSLWGRERDYREDVANFSPPEDAKAFRRYRKINKELELDVNREDADTLVDLVNSNFEHVALEEIQNAAISPESIAIFKILFPERMPYKMRSVLCQRIRHLAADKGIRVGITSGFAEPHDSPDWHRTETEQI